MAWLFKKRSKKVGLSPGELLFTGDKKIDKPRVRLIDYDSENIMEKEADSIEECFPFKDKPTVTWINVDGLHDTDSLEKISKEYKIHPLVMEDIVSRFTRGRDDSVFGLINAVTSVARDTRDPETRWRLEELGGSIPALVSPAPKPGGAEAEIAPVCGA